MWILYGKFFGHVWNHYISRYPPPKKNFVKLLGLKSLSEKGLKRKSKRITVKKYPYTHSDLVERTVVLISVVRSMILIIKLKIILKITHKSIVFN